MDRMILGNPFFFKKHDIDICPSRNLVKHPQMTFHMNEVKGGKKRKILQTPKIDTYCRQKTILQPKPTSERQAIQWNIRRSHTRLKMISK